MGDKALSGFSQYTYAFFQFVGNSNIALTLSAGISIFLLIQSLQERKGLKKILETSLGSAGLIILITCAGGAFGQFLQQTGVGLKIQSMAAGNSFAVLPLAFGVTVLVRTAQGSATVAMITAVGILGGMADPASLGFHPIYLALAIGCGSKPIPWMNDSGFWIISKMSGLTEAEALRHVSTMMSLMGVSGLVLVMVLAELLPLV